MSKMKLYYFIHCFKECQIGRNFMKKYKICTLKLQNITETTQMIQVKREAFYAHRKSNIKMAIQGAWVT